MCVLRVTGKEHLNLGYLSSYTQEITNYVLFVLSLKREYAKFLKYPYVEKNKQAENRGAEIAKTQKRSFTGI